MVAPKPLKPGEWHHVMVTFDGTQGGPSGERPLHRWKTGPRRLPIPNTVGGNIETSVPLRLGARAQRRLETQRQGRAPGFPLLPPPAASRGNRQPSRRTRLLQHVVSLPPERAHARSRSSRCSNTTSPTSTVPRANCASELDSLKTEQAQAPRARFGLTGHGGEEGRALRPRPHPRRLFRQGRKSHAGHSRRAAADAGGRSEKPPRPRPLAQRSRQPAARPRHHEPHLVLLLRQRHRGNQRRLRHHGRPPEPSETARLARRGVHRFQVGPPPHDPAHRHLRHLPPVRRGHAGKTREGSVQQAARPRPALPPRGRADPRPRALRLRPARRRRSAARR